MAADGGRSIALAARVGDGWVTTGSHAAGPQGWWHAVGDSMSRFTDALAAAGRELSEVPTYLSLDASGVYALSSRDSFTDAVGRAGELGFTDVITHWPRPDGPYAGHESVLEAVAADVLSRRSAG